MCRNNTDRTAFAVAPIIELVYRRIGIELPMVKKSVVRSDNAANYSNKLVVVIAAFIFTKYDIKLCSTLLSETQDGKGPADIHLVTAMRYVDWYIDSLTLDVSTPADLVDTIGHGEE